MRVILPSIGFIICIFLDIEAQELNLKSLSLDDQDLKILYYGAYNEIYLESQDTNLFLTSNDAKISKKTNDTLDFYRVKPNYNPDIKDEIYIQIKGLSDNDTILLDSILYKNRFIGCRYRAYLDTDFEMFDIAKPEELLNITEIKSKLPCSHYIKDFGIFQLDLIYVTQKGHKTLTSWSNKITDEQRDEMKTLENGDMLIIISKGEPYPYHSVLQSLDPIIIDIMTYE